MTLQELKGNLTATARAEWSFFYDMAVAFVEYDGRKYMVMADSEQQAIEDVVDRASKAIIKEAKANATARA